MPQPATSHDTYAMTTFSTPMSTPSRIQQIIDHERSIRRSLVPFGLALAVLTVTLVVLTLRQ